MPIPVSAARLAQALQRRAAQDGALQVQLVAGPGTGKSSVIELRVCWLLQQGVAPATIFAVSFTRASSRELRDRIVQHCSNQSQPNATGVRVSTLHSLALRTLRRANLLTHYPVDPLVLDDWELSNIFDTEFGVQNHINSKVRREEIRLYHEAFWNTGAYNPTNYLPVTPPISSAESSAFLAFHRPTTQVYSCVLPGEIVRQCVHHMQGGNIDPVALLNVKHLIVDEFQDLNPMDLKFVYGMIAGGVHAFIAGDDDQSIYSFRYATPAGIQTFLRRYPSTSSHSLDECFRCMPSILAVAAGLISNFSTSNRIPKNLRSLYSQSTPAAPGIVHRWTFGIGSQEARAISESCSRLIQAGVPAGDILILLNNQRVLLPSLEAEFTDAEIPYESGPRERLIEGNAGRLGLALLRVVVDPDDYIAHRTIVGLRNGVGAATTNQIRQAVLQHNLNFRDIFYQALPPHIFRGRALAAINAARVVCNQISQWNKDDSISTHATNLQSIISNALGPQEATAWQNYISALPPDMTLNELRDYIWAEGDDQQLSVLKAIYERLGEQVPDDRLPPPRVKIMTMHGAKGLSARIVFVPGLEDALIPGPWRSPYPGLVMESARLLYVSITRARAALVLSRANRRLVNGRMPRHSPSRFASSWRSLRLAN